MNRHIKNMAGKMYTYDNKLDAMLRKILIYITRIKEPLQIP